MQIRTDLAEEAQALWQQSAGEPRSLRESRPGAGRTTASPPSGAGARCPGRESPGQAKGDLRDALGFRRRTSYAGGGHGVGGHIERSSGLAGWRKRSGRGLGQSGHDAGRDWASDGGRRFDHAPSAAAAAPAF